MRRAFALGLVCALAVLGLPAAARARVDLGPARIVVEGDAGRVVVDRAPFSLRIEDRHGDTVLAEVPGGARAPLASAGFGPEPGGTRNAPPPALYAPLTFAVGAQVPVQDPGSAWEGNLLTGAQSTVQHAARDVVAARALDGDAAELELSTSDPTRRIVLRVSPDGPRFRIAARVTPEDGVAWVADAFATAGDEAFHGFGGRHDHLDQRGHELFSWLDEENYSPGPFGPLFEAAPGTGGDRYLFPNGPSAAYYVQPLVVSSRPYGFLLAQSELSRLRMASDRPDAWQAAVAAPRIEYVVAPGAGARAIEALTALSGRHPEPPEWALRPQTSLNLTAATLTDPAAYEHQLDEQLAQIDRTGVRFSAFGIEGWFNLAPDRVRHYTAELRRRGIHPLLYFTPFLNATTDAAAIESGYSVRDVAGRPYYYTSPFGLLSLVDFTNPAAVRWWQDRIARALDLGADGFMQDWGEQVLTGMRFHDGSTGAVMHNAYPIAYHRATREAVDRYERATGRRILFFTRSGFTGTPGSARYEGANFPGDEHAEFSRGNGIGFLTTDMLSRGVGGAYGYSTDVGGYLDTYGKVTKELWLRWVQWAVLSPVFRFHNSVGEGTRQPWSFDAETLAIYRRYEALRERAAPLIARLWREAAATGMPIARPLWLEDPGDPEGARQDQEWLLGHDVLVAPVVEKGAGERSVYFPRGCWQHGETGARYAGPGSARVRAPLASLPYFVRCGTDPFDVAPARHCRRRRAVRVRLRRGLRAVRVTAAGRRVRVHRRGGRLVARIPLRRRVTRVQITGRTRSGRRVVVKRTFRRCRRHTHRRTR
ncbi:MAG TPA: TIM-barrel domain-containing protein [Solirubrobacteraceae bacterium]|jgi:alpha-D-xyloside xylohydrolase